MPHALCLPKSHIINLPSAFSALAAVNDYLVCKDTYYYYCLCAARAR